jgi:hypothetical protein
VNREQSSTQATFSWITLALAIAALAVVAGTILLAQFRFVPLFVEMGVKIPFPIAALRRMPWWVVLFGILGWCAGLVAKERLSWPRHTTLQLNGLSLIAALAMLTVLVVALFLPLLNLVEGLS